MEWRDKPSAAAPVSGSELESALAGGIGELGHAAMVLVLAAVELDGGHARRFGPLGDRRADQFRRRAVAGGLELVAERLVAGAGGNEQ
jgi:hypothetical protein